MLIAQVGDAGVAVAGFASGGCAIGQDKRYVAADILPAGRGIAAAAGTLGIPTILPSDVFKSSAAAPPSAAAITYMPLTGTNSPNSTRASVSAAIV